MPYGTPVKNRRPSAPVGKRMKKRRPKVPVRGSAAAPMTRPRVPTSPVRYRPA